MRNLNEYAMECMNELDVINVPYVEPVSWIVNTRANRFFGLCSLRNGQYHISIAARLLKDDVDEMALKTVIIHELLHTIRGCMNHGREWKRWAAKVNYEYGYQVERTAKGYYDKYNVEKPEYKYAVRCEKCGVIIGRMRMSDLIANTSKYHHGNGCGGSLVRIDYMDMKAVANMAG